jgi:hypothetical protein
MILFEALYGKKCNTSISWDNPTDITIIGPELLKEMEQQMVRIKQNLKTTYDGQKSYDNKGKVQKQFKVGEHVFLKVKAKRSSVKLGSSPKLAARYHGKFKILERIDHVASMHIHNVFHTYLSINHLSDPNHINDWIMIQVEHKGEFQDEPLHILDQKVKMLKNSAIDLVKV